MKVRLQTSKLGEILVAENLRSVVVNDDFDNPIVIVQKLADGTVMLTSAKDAEFKKVAGALGLGMNTSYKTIQAR